MIQDSNTTLEQPSVATEPIITPNAQPELPEKWLNNYLPMGGWADPFHARLRLGAFRANLVYYQRNRFGDYASHGDYHGCLAPPCYLRSVRWRVGRPLEQKTNHDYLRWCHRFGNALVGHIVCYRKNPNLACLRYSLHSFRGGRFSRVPR